MGIHHDEQALREIPDLDTLKELLARLNEVDHYRPVSRTDKVTVEDIAEALDIDTEMVAQQLEIILEEHRAARISGVIRELEEPLYQVERTGHSAHDPLNNPIYKLRSVQILAERNKVQPTLPRRKQEESFVEKAGNLIGRFILLLMVAIMIILACKTAITMITAK